MVGPGVIPPRFIHALGVCGMSWNPVIWILVGLSATTGCSHCFLYKELSVDAVLKRVADPEKSVRF